MFRIMFGIFIVLHAAVHLLYFGQSAKYFELRPGMNWPDGAWAFSRLLGNEATGRLGGALLLLTALGLLASGIGIVANQAWGRPLVMAAAAFSAIVFVLLWNGKMQNLDGQGGVGILIDAAILAAVFLLQWPR